MEYIALRLVSTPGIWQSQLYKENTLSLPLLPKEELRTIENQDFENLLEQVLVCVGVFQLPSRE
jgi:hypothetical protein